MKQKETHTTRCLESWYSGQEEGLKALLEEHLPWIRRHVKKRLGPLLRRKGETEDFVQDAVVQFLRYGPKIRIMDGNRFRALLTKIVENTLRDQYDRFTAYRRNLAKERPLPEDTRLLLDPPRKGVESPSHAACENEREAWIRLGMELLEPNDREMLIFRQWNKMTFPEIAKHLGISEKAAWMRHNRALVELGKKVGDLRQGKSSLYTDYSDA